MQQVVLTMDYCSLSVAILWLEVIKKDLVEILMELTINIQWVLVTADIATFLVQIIQLHACIASYVSTCANHIVSDKCEWVGEVTLWSRWWVTVGEGDKWLLKFVRERELHPVGVLVGL